MSYKEYVEGEILESGLDETDGLLMILEEAASIDDYQAIEEYLTEKKGSGSVRDKLAAIGKAPANAYGGVKTSVGNMAAAHARKKAIKGEPSERYTSPEDSDVYSSVSDISTAADAAFDKACSNFDKGAIAVGVTALLAAVAGISLKVRSAIKKSNSVPAKQLENQIKELEGQANDVAKRCKKGDITAKEAKVETKKIQAQIKKLTKQAANIVKKDTAKATKESVDIADIQLEIYESCEEGMIDEDERDSLLELLDA